MRRWTKRPHSLLGICLLVLVAMVPAGARPAKRTVVAGDTLLASLVSALLPRERFAISAILPPGQCPGHYDVKLTDIERLQKADLVVVFRNMGTVAAVKTREGARLEVDTGGNNWMVPSHYLAGSERVARELSRRFPNERQFIESALRELRARVADTEKQLRSRLRKAGAAGAPVIGSAMQRQPLEWMGLRVVATYGRPETLSAQTLVDLIALGRRERVVLVADNLQSGPETGKGIAEALGVPRVVLDNFAGEQGYLATLRSNVEAVTRALLGGQREPGS